MKTQNATFEDETITLDFHEFEECKFVRCQIVYHGYGVATLDSCTFDKCRWGFEDAASNTFTFLSALAQGDAGSADLFEQIINDLRGGRPTTEPSPQA